MVSGRRANLIFFNKKIKIGRPEYLLTPLPIRPIISHLYLTPHPPPLKMDVYMYITPNTVNGAMSIKINCVITELDYRIRLCDYCLLSY